MTGGRIQHETRVGIAHAEIINLPIPTRRWGTLKEENFFANPDCPASMSAYRRFYRPGSTVFLTLVTYHRIPIFADSQAVADLRKAMAVMHSEMPFEITAAVILLDHLHFLWTLPPNDCDYSKQIGRLKVLFTQALRGKGGLPQNVSLSRKKHRESDVWQRRFWEHTITNEEDLARHFDYLHYNPSQAWLSLLSTRLAVLQFSQICAERNV